MAGYTIMDFTTVIIEGLAISAMKETNVSIEFTIAIAVSDLRLSGVGEMSEFAVRCPEFVNSPSPSLQLRGFVRIFEFFRERDARRATETLVLGSLRSPLVWRPRCAPYFLTTSIV